MTRRRRWLVYGLAAFIVAGNLYDGATGGEHWPFSSYPMYSHVNREWGLALLRVVGVRSDPPGDEVPLWESAHLEPFDQSRLGSALSTLLAQPDGLERVDALLRNCLLRYERRRRGAAHDGPPLRALRLYDLAWTLEPRARNADHPGTRRLLAEAALPTTSIAE
jgi:hypothetical protein